ncbi:MAG TPA: retropepsin-like aspartic protease [Planctomycetota bacterium]|nr:retropepsin-like aspartic protease [Planctomycetota bacterium]
MRHRFNPQRGVVLVTAKLWGPSLAIEIPLALDTGAVNSVLNWQTATLLGYDPAGIPERVRIVGATGEVWVPRLGLSRVEALGQERLNFPFLCHTLPPAAGIDGLLGLDFLRGHRLTLDFREGLIGLD